MMTAKRTQSALAPLTRINSKTGETYARPSKVREQIEAFMGWPLQRAFELAAEGALYPQTLVYLMRNFRPHRRSPAYDAVVLAFFSRLERAGDRIVRDLTEAQKDWVRTEVVTKVAEWLPNDRMDIFEVSFKLGAERLFLTALTKVRLRTQSEVSLHELVEADSDLTGEEVADAVAWTRAGPMQPMAEARLELKQLLASLTERERLAVAYVEILGLSEKEAGERLGCTDRNVRYLTSRARAKARDQAGPGRASAGRKE